MKVKLKRILSMVLVLMMVFTLIPLNETYATYDTGAGFTL